MKRYLRTTIMCLLMVVMALSISACKSKVVEDVSATDVSTFYDGTGYSIDIKGTKSGDTLTYATSQAGVYSAEKPSFTNVGEYTVYFKVARAGYITYESSKAINIVPATLTVTPKVLSKEVGIGDPVLTFEYAGNVTGETPRFSGALTRATGEVAGNYLVSIGTLALVDNGTFKASNYSLKLSTTVVNFTITPVVTNEIDITDAEIELVEDTSVYNGTAFAPAIESVMLGTTALSASNYTIAYANNIDAGTATVTITGKADYVGTASATFVISKATLTVTPNEASKEEGEEDSTLSYSFSGNVAAETPNFSGKLARAEGEEVGSYLINIGTLALADNGSFKASNYTIQFAEVYFEIVEKPLVEVDITDAIIALDIDSFIYNGEENEPAIASVMNVGTALNENDYTIAYSNNINAGTATVTITGEGNFVGTASIDFDITPATLTVTPNEASKVFGEDDGILTYSFVGNIDGEIPAFAGTLARAIGEDAGSYIINIGTLGLVDNDDFIASNYALELSEILVDFTITPADIDSADVVLDIDSFVYNGEANEPEIASVMNGGTVLNENDYTIAYSNNINAGTATVTITGKGNYEGTASIELDITPATLTVTPNEASKVFGEDDDTLTYEFAGNIDGETPAFSGELARALGEEVGSYLINIGTLVLADNEGFVASNYVLVLSEDEVNFEIEKADIANVVIVLSNNSFVYNGAAAKPAITSAKLGDASLTASDYTSVYASNLNVGTATLTITGKGNYEGTASANFSITPATLTVKPNALSKQVNNLDPTLSYSYSGNVGNETPLFSGTLSREEGEEVGTYVINIGTLALADNGSFKASNYNLVLSANIVHFTIIEEEVIDIDITNAVITLANNSFVYNGEEIEPTILSVMLDEESLTAEDYTVEYSNNINAGTATVTITGEGIYIGSPKVTFSIIPATLTVTPNELSKVFGEADPTLTYTFSGNVTGEIPAFAGTLARAEGENVGDYLVDIGTLAIEDNEDFVASNYTLELSEDAVNFTITKLDITDTIIVLANDSFVYNGEAATPAITSAMLDEVSLIASNYTIAYANNKNAGTATLTITGKGNYEGTASVSFSITKATLTITPDELSKVYGEDDGILTYEFAGNIDGEIPAFAGTLARAEGEDAGSYLVSIGTLAIEDNEDFVASNYTLELDEEVVNFTIAKFDITDAVVELYSYSFGYDGEEIAPTIASATIGETTLDENDYTIAYTDNQNAGKATVTITGKGNYEGTASIEFDITPATLTVTPNEASKVYGEDDGTLTYEVSGIRGEEVPAFSGALERAEGEDAGNYLVSIGTLAIEDNEDFVASNYILVLSEDAVNFTITRFNITGTIIVLANDSFVYNGEAATPAISSAMLDEVSLIASNYTIAYANNKNAGTATLTITGKGNYEGTASVSFSITKATLTVIPDELSKETGDDDPTLTYTVSGDIDGETPSFTGTLSRASGEAMGTYLISIGTLAIEDNDDFNTSNYLLVFSEVEVYFSITPCNCYAENGYACFWTGSVESDITVLGTREGDIIEYSNDATTWYLDQSEITFDQSGSQPVIYRVTRNSVIIKTDIAFMVVEKAFLVSDFEDGTVPSMVKDSRAGAWTIGQSQLSIVDYNGSKMMAAAYTAGGMNGIAYDVFSSIPTGANYLAIDIYTSGTITYNNQFYKYSLNRGTFQEVYNSGSQVTEQLGRTVYASLSGIDASYPWLGILMNISSGYGTIYYDNLRFTETNIPVASPEAPAGPIVIEPALNSIKSANDVTFVWYENLFSESYNIYLYNDEECTDLIDSYLNLTGCYKDIDISSLTISQKVYWKVTSMLIIGEESQPTLGFFNYSDYAYQELNTIDFQAGELGGVSWRNNTGGATWNDMQGSDLVELPNGDTVYKSGTTSGTYLMGVRQTLAGGAMASGEYDTISFTLSTDFPGTYLYRIWIYNTGGQNYELTYGSGVAIEIGKNATTFYRKLEYSGGITKDNINAYAVQLMGNANPVYFHSMGILDMSYVGSITPVSGNDFVLDKGALTLNGTLDWADLDMLTGEYYVQLWYMYMGQKVWFVGGDTVYDSEYILADVDMSAYSSYLGAFTEKDYVCNYKIIAKSSLNDAGATTIEGTVTIFVTVIT